MSLQNDLHSNSKGGCATIIGRIIKVFSKKVDETFKCLLLAEYDVEFKKNAVKLSYASHKPVKEIASDLGISEAMLYRWRQKYTPEGDKTRYATLEEENRDCVLKTRN